MFSVIIPLFNKSAYIEKCLYSVYNQTYQDFEVIVINDGSTDDGAVKVQRMIEKLLKGNREIVEEAAKEPITRAPIKNTFINASEGKTECVNFGARKIVIQLINQDNFGVSTARNNGVKAAKSNYIAFLDADDWWEPTYLEEMVNLIEAFPEAGIYGSNYNLIKNGRKRVAPVGVEPSFTEGIINYCLVYAKTLCMPLWTGATVILKSVFESENGFKPVLKLGEDFDLWIRVILKYPLAFMNKPLSNYNQDVELLERAVGNLHNTENHVLWNLDYLANEEQTNPDLKQLLDNLRVYGLFPYFLKKKFRESVRLELEKVDWTKQPASAKWKYTIPVPLLNIWLEFMYLGSLVKQKYNLVPAKTKK